MPRWWTRSGACCCAGIALLAGACDPTFGGYGDVAGAGGSAWASPGDTGGGGAPTSSSAVSGGGAQDSSAVILAPTPPPPLSGGTMLVAADGVTAVASDPDRDTVWWTALTGGAAVRSVALHPGDEPGRLVEDAAGRVHVVLRRAGAVATLDLAKGTVSLRTPVCPAPRGIDYDPDLDAIVVACVGGELVTLAAADHTVLRSLSIDSDLRDVVVLGGGFLAVSRLRSAEVLLLDPKGNIHTRTRPPAGASEEAVVAWRTVRVPGTTSVAVAYQRATTLAVQLMPSDGYSGGGTGDIVTGGVGVLSYDLGAPDAAPAVTSIGVPGALPVDVAFDPGREHIAVAVYGSQAVYSADLDASFSPSGEQTSTLNEATSIAFDATGRRVAFVREPAGFVVGVGSTDATTIAPTAAPSVADTGYSLFHLAPNQHSQLACASCHPEGRDDGRVWLFDPIGSRRTPSLVGGILATAPFHWDGDLPDVSSLMAEVYTRRMGGLVEDSAHVAAVARFLDAIPRVSVAPRSSSGIDHGKALFESAELGCTACHSGPRFTDDATVDVGTGRPFQVPSLLGVGLRAPYLHNGCAATLADRFGPCGGGDMHGHTSQLSPGDIADLSAYLGSL